MSIAQNVTPNYVDVNYRQFSASAVHHFAIRLVGALTWPLVLPLALAARLSNFFFRTASELFALAPYLFGMILRYEFYKFALPRCGRNVLIGFGTVFCYRDVQIGDNVHIGMYNTIHHCDIGSYVLIADRCTLLSGSRHHNFDRTDLPMALQGGKFRRIKIGDDCWIGASAVVMNDVGEGSVVGAGAVVTAPVEPYLIVVGNPAQVVRSRR